MWCSTCQRDVPALGSAGGVRCTKCGSTLAITDDQPSMPAGNITPSRPAAATRPLEGRSVRAALRSSSLGEADWQLEADLRGIHRLITSLKNPSGHTALTRPVPAPHGAMSRAGSHTAIDKDDGDGSGLPQQPRLISPSGHMAAWLVLSLGLAVFACGGVLLGWSLIGRREDLWPLGMPLALIGQAGLILGLVLHLDGLWNTSRKTAAVLSELGGELKNVRQATSLLSTSQGGPGQAFYLHLAEGASPQLLLADLKGQMDIIAQQMALHQK